MNGSPVYREVGCGVSRRGWTPYLALTTSAFCFEEERFGIELTPEVRKRFKRVEPCMNGRISESPDGMPSRKQPALLTAKLLLLLGRYNHWRKGSPEEPSALTADAPHDDASETSAYLGLLPGYNRLRDGTASKTDVDELRHIARSFINAHAHKPSKALQEVNALLGWLNYARTTGRVTITVRQLRERKQWGLWAMECGIDAGGQRVKAAMNVKGEADVNGCVLQIPWDPDSSITVWMHLTDAGYETCWGHAGPIGVTAKEVVQEQSGLLREFCADQFGKDFKVRFTISRNFTALPTLSDYCDESRTTP